MGVTNFCPNLKKNITNNVFRYNFKTYFELVNFI